MADSINYKVTIFFFCSIFVLLYMVDDMINISDKITYNYQYSTQILQLNEKPYSWKKFKFTWINLYNYFNIYYYSLI